MTGPVITTTFRESGADDPSNAFERVGKTSQEMGDRVEESSDSMKDSSSSFDTMSEGADTMETRFTGFYDTLGGTKDALAAFSDESLSTSDKLIALGQAGADLAGGLAGFVIPAVQSMWTKLTGSTIATAALTAAQTVWTTVTKGAAAAMAFLNNVMQANPILFIVSLITILVVAFLALWTRSEGFRNFFKNMWSGIQTTVGNVVRWIVDRFNGLMDFFRNFPARVGAALGAIGNVFSGIFRGAVNILIDALNWGIDRINDLIYGINLVNPFDDIPSIPKLKRLHTGGIVPGVPGTEVPIMAMAGEEVSTSSQRSSTNVIVRVAPGADKGVGNLIEWLFRKKYVRIEV